MKTIFKYVLILLVGVVGVACTEQKKETQDDTKVILTGSEKNEKQPEQIPMH